MKSQTTLTYSVLSVSLWLKYLFQFSYALISPSLPHLIKFLVLVGFRIELAQNRGVS